MKGNWKLQPWKAIGFLPPKLPNSDFEHLSSDSRPLYEKLHQKRLNIVLWFTISTMLALAAWLWVVFSLCMDISINEADDFMNWFAPSGAVLVFAGLFLEFRIGRMINYKQTDAEGTVLEGYPQAGGGIPAWLSRIEIISFAMILIGTVVWAYGDKIMLALTN